jgi:hypothetical protein
MSESVALSVMFRTSNPKPKEELTGIFVKYFGSISLTVTAKKSHNFFYVGITELCLNEAWEGIQQVIHHAHANGRDISITVEYGVIHKDFDKYRSNYGT